MIYSFETPTISPFKKLPEDLSILLLSILSTLITSTSIRGSFSSILTFIKLNYIINNSKIHNYEYKFFAEQLKKDKEFCIKYGFNTYYSHITGIDDISFVKNILTKGDEILHNRALKTHNEKETHGKIFVYDQAFKPNIDICNLNIIYNLGYSFEEIVSNEVLTSLVFSDFNNWNDRKIKLILDNSFSNTLKNNKKFFRRYIESYVRLDPSDLKDLIALKIRWIEFDNKTVSIGF